MASAGARPAPGPSCGPDNPDGFGGEIAPSVRLRQDLPCHAYIDSGPRASTLTIDLGGHTITGGLLNADKGNVVLKNGTINGGIASQNAGGVILKRIHLNGSIQYANMTFGYGIEVHSSTVTESITMFQGGVIDHSVIGGGITVSDDFFGLQITITNNVVNNSGIVINASFGYPDVSGVIERNVVNNSPGAGILIGNVGSIGSLTVHKNLVTGSVGDGIGIYYTHCYPLCAQGGNPGPVVVRGNQALNNGGHGINAVSTPPAAPSPIVDGGNNRASGNLTDPQCVGIVCKP